MPLWWIYYESFRMQRNQTKRFRLVSPFRSVGLILLWLALGLLFLLYTLHNYFTVAQVSANKINLYDFKLFYSGVLDYFSGGSIYNPSAVLPFERISGSSNNNSPIGTLLFIPFAQLPLVWAAALWNTLSLILLFWGLSFVWRIYPLPQQWHWRAAIVLFVYTAYPVSDALQLGTWGMIIAFLDFTVWYFARKQDEKRAGVLLGLAITCRWQPFTLVLYFLSLQRWRFLFFSALSILCTSILALLIFGLNSFVEFGRLAISISGQGFGNGAYDGSLRAVLGRFAVLLNLDLSPSISFLWLALALTLLGVTLWRCRRLSFDYAYSLMLVCGLLVTPLSWMHYHMALLLPMTVLFANRRYLAVVYTGLLWVSINIFVPVDFDNYPLLGGTLLSLSLFLLYLSLFRGVRNEDKKAGATLV